MDAPLEEKAGGEQTEVSSVTEEPDHEGRHHLVHGLVDPIHLFKEDNGEITSRYLLPRPTDDPQDPLTWPSWRKHAAFASVCYFVFLSNYVTASLSPILIAIVEDFQVSLTKASYLVTFNILFLGIGNLFWIPVSRKIGKRPVIVAGTLVNFVCCIWAARAGSWGSLFASRILQGFGASPSEVLAPAVVRYILFNFTEDGLPDAPSSQIADVYFLHERGAKMGIFTLMIAWGSALGGVFGGLVANANPNWRWVLWMGVILEGVSVLVALLFQAETNFDRPKETEDGEGFESSGLESLRAQSHRRWIKSLTLSGWYDKQTSIWWLFWRPFTLLRYPIVLWAALTHGVLLGWVVLQLTADSGYFPALYNYSELAVGNINISNLVGALIGCIAGGAASDWTVAFIAKRRKGYFQPEYRLWCLLPIFVFGPIGLMMWGFGLGNHLHPMVSIAGVGITYGVLCAGAAVALTYVVDSYRSVTGEGATILIAFRNAFAFGLSFAVFPWLKSNGFIKVTGYMVLIEGVIFLLAIPMYIFGPKSRVWTSTFLV